MRSYILRIIKPLGKLVKQCLTYGFVFA